MELSINDWQMRPSGTLLSVASLDKKEADKLKGEVEVGLKTLQLPDDTEKPGVQVVPVLDDREKFYVQVTDITPDGFKKIFPNTAVYQSL